MEQRQAQHKAKWLRNRVESDTQPSFTPDLSATYSSRTQIQSYPPSIGQESKTSGIHVRQERLEEKKQAKMAQLEAEMYKDLTFHPQICAKKDRKKQEKRAKEISDKVTKLSGGLRD